MNIDAITLKFVKIDATVFQQVYRVLRIHVLLRPREGRETEKKSLCIILVYFGKIEREIELPSASRRKRAVAVGKGQAELNDFQQIDIASQSLIMVFWKGGEETTKTRATLSIFFFFSLKNCTIAFARK